MLNKELISNFGFKCAAAASAHAPAPRVTAGMPVRTCPLCATLNERSTHADISMCCVQVPRPSDPQPYVGVQRPGIWSGEDRHDRDSNHTTSQLIDPRHCSRDARCARTDARRGRPPWQALSRGEPCSHGVHEHCERELPSLPCAQVPCLTRRSSRENR